MDASRQYCQYFRSVVTSHEAPHSTEHPSYRHTLELTEWCEHPRSVYPGKQTPERLPCGGDLKKCVLPSEGDKRKHFRFSNALPIEYRRIDDPKVLITKTTNICESGLMASLSERIGVDEKLLLKIFFPTGRDLRMLDAIGVIAKVIWTKPDEEKMGYYRTGMKFEDISAKDLERLKNFLYLFQNGY